MDQETDKKVSVGLPLWFVQILAWITGIGGIIMDYGFKFFGEEHIPIIYYAVLVGLAFGMNPGSLIKVIVEAAQSQRGK